MSKSTPKDSSRVRGDARERRMQRQDEALARQNEYETLPIEARLARIEGRRGASKKQRAKLLKAIEKRGKVG